MKKTLLALAVLAAASSVNAAEIYKNESTSLKATGEVDIFLRASEIEPVGAKADKEELNINHKGLIQIDFEHKLNDSVTAFGSFEIEGEKAAEFDDVYAGFKGGFGKVTFGETGDAIDAIEKTDISNEGIYLGTPGHLTESKGYGARYQVSFADLALSLDWQSTKADGADDAIGISADYNFGMGSVAASFVDYGKQNSKDASVAGVAVSFEAVENLYLAASWSTYENTEFEVEAGSDKTVVLKTTAHDGDVFGLAASYQIDKVRLYTTYALASADKDLSGSKLDADLSNILVGVDYQLADNLKLFAEYNSAELDGKNVTDAYLFVSGFYLTF
ncbi:porin [Vibrio ordalii]|uniref:porin n=1 Tax=Vibrio ordalii TaxID=28174 RepID=UPI0002D383E5|nr:porin [Vibrio ordalii]OEE73887.1 hypothetical protein A1QQ_00775 [Vibrio ordalii FF-167]